MTELLSKPPPRDDALGRVLHAVAYGFAIAGGLLMLALIVMVVVSILGRALIDAPVYGDFEMVAMGTAISVSLSLPYCQITRGNVIVDLFLARAPLWVRGVCDALSGLLLALLAGVLAGRAVGGMADMLAYNEVTMILAIPVWWAFPFLVASLALLALVSLYTAWCDLRALMA